MPSNPRHRLWADAPSLHRLGCTSYAPGHNVHWIQALHTVNKPEVAAESWHGRVLELSGTRLLVQPVEPPRPTLPRTGGSKIAGHGKLRLRSPASGSPPAVSLEHHDAERLAWFVQGNTSVLVNDQYAILRVGSYCFSVTTGSLDPCPTDALPAAASEEHFAQRLRTHGGFSAPSNAAEGEGQ